MQAYLKQLIFLTELPLNAAPKNKKVATANCSCVACYRLNFQACAAAVTESFLCSLRSYFLMLVCFAIWVLAEALTFAPNKACPTKHLG
eukprot:3685415-Amphidinium_carterae.1